MRKSGRHPNYQLLNLIGYGLSKFGSPFVSQFGFKTKSAFYRYLVELGVAETEGTIKNRQDLFDPFFDTTRKGWWQKGEAYLHRKQFIDSVLGMMDVVEYAKIVQMFLREQYPSSTIPVGDVAPVLLSRFRQLQITGAEAELYFIRNFNDVERFRAGTLEDARLFGDGYDFQVSVAGTFYLVEVKGLRCKQGAIRMTENEFNKAAEHRANYALAVVCDLDSVPSLSAVFDPIHELSFKRSESHVVQVSYHCMPRTWY